LSTISKHRIQNWLAFIFLGIGALLTAILGLFAHVRATATPCPPQVSRRVVGDGPMRAGAQVSGRFGRCNGGAAGDTSCRNEEAP
jgi:hypothetical protein